MTTAIPGSGLRLSASEPGWWEDSDVIVVGSGIAGLSVALRMRAQGYRVLVVTKAQVDQGSTRWAQGGIAASLSDEDSPQDHFMDTLLAGAGLCDEDAVRVLVDGGAPAIAALRALGADFDVTESGDLALTREGGHLRDRIAHAGGDATGEEIVRTLVTAVIDDPGITLYEQALGLDLLLDARGAVQGLTLHVMGQGQRDGVGAVLAPVVVLATGGLGQVFSSSTNPVVATGDGVAMALRAGAVLADMEFVQFHPTVMWLGEDATGQQPLVSEAVRGEGAVLLDHAGNRFMADVHPLADLAPRDVVAKAAMHRMLESGSSNVWLDARHLGEELWRARFPTILRRTRELGVDPVSELIPVAPAQHYSSGGVRTDLSGRSSVAGLYACGEVACTGVHGANRLASNSLLEGVVFADRIATVLAAGLPPRRDPIEYAGSTLVLHDRARSVIQKRMSDGAGVLRSEVALRDAIAGLSRLPDTMPGSPCTNDWETTNLLSVASVLAHQARLRTETRGSHWREDYPATDDRHWRHHLHTVLENGRMRTTSAPLHSPTWPSWQGSGS
jgi:L-aspartate oxidase